MLKEVLDTISVLENPSLTADDITDFLNADGVQSLTTTLPVTMPSQSDSFHVITALIRGAKGKSSGGTAPTICIIGQLGGLAVRPYEPGLISDADGAICSLSVAKKLITMSNAGDRFTGDIFVTTHNSTRPPLKPNPDGQPAYPYSVLAPTTFDNIHKIMLKSMEQFSGANSDQVDAFFSVDATKGNDVVNVSNFAITPVVVNGWIVPFSNELLNEVTQTTGLLPNVMPLSIYDITPYELLYNPDYTINITRINSILAPSIQNTKPYIGVATTAIVNVPGSAGSANFYSSLESAGRFMLEAARKLGENRYKVFSETDYENAQGQLDLSGFRTMGK
jgi:hypothetical protein